MLAVARRSAGRLWSESACAPVAIDIGRRAAASSSTGSSPSLPVDLLELYRAEVDKGTLQWDDEQVRVVVAVRRLRQAGEILRTVSSLMLVPSSAIAAAPCLPPARKLHAVAFAAADGAANACRGRTASLAAWQLLADAPAPQDLS